MRYPYLNRGFHAYPLIPVMLTAGERSLLTEGLIDSGANVSLFPADIARYLGLALESGTPAVLSGVAGQIQGYRHTVEISVGVTTFGLTATFSDAYTSAFNILGRDNFFSNFQITFNEPQQYVDIDPIR